MNVPVSKQRPGKKRTTGDYVAQAIVWFMFACTAAAVPAFVCDWFGQLKDDYWLSYRGVLARESTVYHYHEPTQRTGADFCVTYVTGTRSKHDRCLDFEPEFFNFIEPDRSRPMIVHYDPAAPDHISTSWGVQLLPLRTFTFIVYFIPCLVIELLSVYALLMIPTGRWMD